jgi:pantetheine-phosphate adenylyltransferase
VTVAVVPASFDPITQGHVDIVTRASRLFDRIVVGVFARPHKNVMFSLDERVEMVRESLAHLHEIEVVPYDGLTVNFAADVGATVVVRGLRAVSDFESEFQQAALNRKMSPGLEVISMFASVEYGFLSSSLIKEIAENGGDIAAMVPVPVAKKLSQRFAAISSPSASRG